MRKPLIFASALSLMSFIASPVCNAKADAEPIKVFVSILPQTYFVQRVGGARVKVTVLVGPGQSPHAYDPTPRQMSELAKAKVFFRIGVPFEKSMIPKIESTFKNLTIVDTRKGIKLRQMAEDPGHGDERAVVRHETAQERHQEKQGHRGEEDIKKDVHDGEKRDPAHVDDHDHEAGEPDPHIWLDPILATDVPHPL